METEPSQEGKEEELLDELRRKIKLGWDFINHPEVSHAPDRQDYIKSVVDLLEKIEKRLEKE